MPDDYLASYRRLDLDRLNLAAGVILAGPYTLTPALAAELITFKKRVERALLQPDPEDDIPWPRLLDPGAALVLIDPDLGVRCLDPAQAAEVQGAITTLREYCLLAEEQPPGSNPPRTEQPQP
jgi:hypothetical protein